MQVTVLTIEDWARWRDGSPGKLSMKIELGAARSCSKPWDRGWNGSFWSHCECPGGKTPSRECTREHPRGWRDPHHHWDHQQQQGLSWDSMARKVSPSPTSGADFLVHRRNQIKGSHILCLYLWYLSGRHAAKLCDNYLKTKKNL